MQLLLLDIDDNELLCLSCAYRQPVKQPQTASLLEYSTYMSGESRAWHAVHYYYCSDSLSIEEAADLAGQSLAFAEEMMTAPCSLCRDDEKTRKKYK